MRRAFYNTTGILVNGRFRHRSVIYGSVRFNEVGGFNAAHVEENIGRAFESTGPVRMTRIEVFLRQRASRRATPDCFLFAITSERTGELQIAQPDWISEAVTLVSFSQFGHCQEALLLMPVQSWIRGSLGRFVVEPRQDRPGRAFLRLVG
jgi:hypothetical protein